MDKLWPALDAREVDSDLLLAAVDDYAPTAVEDHEGAVRVFFNTSHARDEALAHLKNLGTLASLVDVPDEDWARRSQENIKPIFVGRICVAPPWHAPDLKVRPTSDLVIVIQPSMGFGTGHHATTRLCLAALQSVDLTGKSALDVGTGSGVLAIAACMLGARAARGIDNDADAIQSAEENIGLNPGVPGVSVELADLGGGLEALAADVVTANLTGALLERAAGTLLLAVRAGGVLILSGLMVPERALVEAAFSSVRLINAWEEDGWAALAFQT